MQKVYKQQPFFDREHCKTCGSIFQSSSFHFFSSNLCDAFEVETNPFLKKKIKRKNSTRWLSPLCRRKKNYCNSNLHKKKLSTTTYSKKEGFF